MGRTVIGGLEVFAAFKVTLNGIEEIGFLMQGPALVVAAKPTPIVLGLPDDIVRAEVTAEGGSIHPGPTGLIGGIVAGLLNYAFRNSSGMEGSVRVWPRNREELVFRGDAKNISILEDAFKKLGVTMT